MEIKRVRRVEPTVGGSPAKKQGEGTHDEDLKKAAKTLPNLLPPEKRRKPREGGIDYEA